jgi:hypothetical protein
MLGLPSKSREELLATPIGELVACWVGVRCTDRCNRSSYLPLRLMAAKRGARTLLGEVVRRLRCEHRKTTPSSTWLVDYPIEGGEHGGRVATWRVELTAAADAMPGAP